MGAIAPSLDYDTELNFKKKMTKHITAMRSWLLITQCRHLTTAQSSYLAFSKVYILFVSVYIWGVYFFSIP